jgi:YD repeat-containing protein
MATAFDTDDFFAHVDAAASSPRLAPDAPSNDEGARVPPHDLDAEAAVLGSVLYDAERLAELSALRPDQFSSEAHRRTFEAIRAVEASGAAVSLVTVTSKLRELGRLEQVGGSAALSDLVASTAVLTAKQLASIVEIVLERYRARQAIFVAQRLAAQAYAGDAPGPVVAAAVEELRALQPTTTSSDGFIYGESLATPLEPIVWLCPALKLTTGRHTLVAGNAFAGKSLTMQDIALAVASGGDAFGAFRCRRGRVRWLDYDGQGQRVTKDRFQRLARFRGVDLRDLDQAIGYTRNPGFFVDDEEATDRLCRLLEGVDLCVIDSWRGATPSTDEWSRAEVERVANRIDTVSTKTGCVIVIVDHNVKPSRDAGPGGRSTMHDVHGSTAKTESPQSHFVFTGEDGEPMTHVVHKKERVEGHTVSPFALRFEDIERDGDPRWGLRVAHVDPEQLSNGADSNAVFEKTVERVRECIGQNPGIAGAETVAQRVGLRATSVRAAVASLLGAGAVVDRKAPGRGRGRLLFLAHMAPPEAP